MCKMCMSRKQNTIFSHLNYIAHTFLHIKDIKCFMKKYYYVLRNISIRILCPSAVVPIWKTSEDVYKRQILMSTILL